MSEVGTAGQRVDVLAGGDVDPDGHLVSVAELQAALHALTPTVHHSHSDAASPQVEPAGPSPNGQAQSTGESPADAPTDRGETRPVPHDSPDRDQAADAGQGPADFDSDWIAVIAGHPGAGASTVALAVLDSLTSRGAHPRLIDTAATARSSLVAASTDELGVDPTGSWARGRRGQATLYRRTDGRVPESWPVPTTTGPTASHTVVDLGLPASTNLDRLRHCQARTVLVCRVTVPGLRLSEQILTHLGPTHPVLVAAVGERRWPGSVTASLGPRLRALREAGRLVPLPIDRHLEVTGLTGSPLPAAVNKSADRLLDLLLDDRA